MNHVQHLIQVQHFASKRPFVNLLTQLLWLSLLTICNKRLEYLITPASSYQMVAQVN